MSARTKLPIEGFLTHFGCFYCGTQIDGEDSNDPFVCHHMEPDSGAQLPQRIVCRKCADPGTVTRLSHPDNEDYRKKLLRWNLYLHASFLGRVPEALPPDQVRANLISNAVLANQVALRG